MFWRGLVLFVVLALPAGAQKSVVPRLETPLGGFPMLPAVVVSPFSAVSSLQPLSVSVLAEPVLASPARTVPHGTKTIAPSATPASEKTKKPELPRSFSEHFAARTDHPAMRRYREMMEELSVSWGSPFDGATLNKAQLEVAEAANVTLQRPKKSDGVLVIPGGGGSWINRWARGLERNLGVTLLWSPLSNHNLNRGAGYSSSGWLWADNFGPLLTKPNAELLHEFLHAYVDRGKYSRQFAPLRLSFIDAGWWSLPKADVYKDNGYSMSGDFQSDEILTNFHTVYHRAMGIAEEYGKTPGDWTGSAYEDAPQEVQRLLRWIDNPLFLSESVEEMSASLISGVQDLARTGLQGKKFKKTYHRFNGSIPYAGEVEENAKKDHGFYEAVVREGKNEQLTVRFLTRGQFDDEEAARANIFPVFIGNGRYSARVKFALDKVLQYDLDDPTIQEQIAAAAASLLAPQLAQLIEVNQRLVSPRERLKALQLAGKQRVDLALVREVRDTARAAFLAVVRYFIRQPAFAPGRS
ncbi:MAG: hypothetical protein AAB036_01965 [Elusimicrobiota bacterium]